MFPEFFVKTMETALFSCVMIIQVHFVIDFLQF